MQNFENPKSIDDARSISTAQAARMLGLSTTMLQKLVDQERVKAWKRPADIGASIWLLCRPTRAGCKFHSL